jgi:hypothetical protein
MSRVTSSLPAYVKSDHLLAETVNEGLEIRSGIDIQIDIQKLGVLGSFRNGRPVFSE